MKTVKIGDYILCRGGFGGLPAKKEKVIGLTLTEYPREKDGDSVQEVTETQIKENLVLFDLDNGHWCYSEQVELF